MMGTANHKANFLVFPWAPEKDNTCLASLQRTMREGALGLLQPDPAIAKQHAQRVLHFSALCAFMR